MSRSPPTPASSTTTLTPNSSPTTARLQPLPLHQSDERHSHRHLSLSEQEKKEEEEKEEEEDNDVEPPSSTSAYARLLIGGSRAPQCPLHLLFVCSPLAALALGFVLGATHSSLSPPPPPPPAAAAAPCPSTSSAGGVGVDSLLCPECISHYAKMGSSALPTAVTGRASTGVCPELLGVWSCSGYCPTITPHHLIHCAFLPPVSPFPRSFHRSISLDCLPPPDQCPSHNAWLKDALLPTLYEVHQLPASLRSNFTLGGRVDVTMQMFAYRGAAVDQWASSQWTPAYIEGFRASARARLPLGTYQSSALYPVLDAYAESAVRERRVAVIGTEQP